MSKAKTDFYVVTWVDGRGKMRRFRSSRHHRVRTEYDRLSYCAAVLCRVWSDGTFVVLATRKGRPDDLGPVGS